MQTSICISRVTSIAIVLADYLLAASIDNPSIMAMGPDALTPRARPDRLPAPTNADERPRGACL